MTDRPPSTTAVLPRSRYWFVALTAIIALILFTLPGLNVSAQETTETPVSITDIVTAANTFLDRLDETQRTAVMFDFNDETQRNNWSNFPTGIYQRAGLAYGSLTTDQQTAAMALLQAALSEEGYQKVINIMTGDEVLRQTDSGGNLIFGYGQYYVSFLGTPSETDPWILQWGGHHLALNITFSGTNEVLTPSHTGCQPCTYIINDQQVNVLGDEYTKALALVNVLDADQQAEAVLDYEVTNLVLGPGEEERVLEPEGLPGSSMTADEQAMLLDVVSEWVNIAPSAAATARMAEIAANINDTYFAWSGDTSETSSTAYFRITGPSLLIEFSPQTMGCANASSQGGQGSAPTGGNGGAPSGDSNAQTTNPTADNDFQLDLGTFEAVNDASALCHVHTIYRDPTNPYGSATIGQ